MLSLKNINKASLEGFDSLPGDAYVRLSVLLSLYGYSRATLYRNIKKGIVPKPDRLGERISGWRVAAVRESLLHIRQQGASASGIKQPPHSS